MKIKKIWLWTGIIAIVLLIILGMYGENLSLHETSKENEEVVQAYDNLNQNVDNGEEIEKVYDSSIHLRSKPLKDPFHTEGIAKVKAEMEKNMKSKKNSVEVNAKTLKNQKRAESVPILYGVASLGNSRNAILSYNNNSVNAKEGDSVGQWRVVNIGEKSVEITNGMEIKTLILK